MPPTPTHTAITSLSVATRLLPCTAEQRTPVLHPCRWCCTLGLRWGSWESHWLPPLPRACAMPVLGLCWACAVPVLGLCWACAVPVLGLCWACDETARFTESALRDGVHALRSSGGWSNCSHKAQATHGGTVHSPENVLQGQEACAADVMGSGGATKAARKAPRQVPIVQSCITHSRRTSRRIVSGMVHTGRINLSPHLCITGGVCTLHPCVKPTSVQFIRGAEPGRGER